jgi:hypothetical protein
MTASIIGLTETVSDNGRQSDHSSGRRRKGRHRAAVGSEIRARCNEPAFILRLAALMPTGVRLTTLPPLDIIEDDHFGEPYAGGPEESCTLAVCVCPKEVVQPMVTLSPGWYGSSSSVSVLVEATV